MKKIVLAGILLFTVLAYSGCMQVPSTTDENPAQITVTNFEECVAAGNPVMESYPRQCRANDQTFTEEIAQPIESTMTEAEAKVIAEQTCIKGGEALTSGGTYNSNSKTWWFDANLNATQPGCYPACVVSEETKTAEINWRCTGLIMPESPSADAIKQVMSAKYPKYSSTLSIEIGQETEGFARGNVSFEEGQPGGYFFAKLDNGEWKVVLDGNGQIPCTLKDQGFPEDMLADCAE